MPQVDDLSTRLAASEAATERLAELEVALAAEREGREAAERAAESSSSALSRMDDESFEVRASVTYVTYP